MKLESHAQQFGLTLLRGAVLYGPEHRGVQDILVAGRTVLAIDSSIDPAGFPVDVDVHDLRGDIAAPGLIDGHIHITGGGGNRGFRSRLPELWLRDLLEAGITTVVGTPGMDMVSKAATGNLAKAMALEAEGLSSYVYVGGFFRPFSTLTRSVLEDLYVIPKTAGVKLALADERASQYSDEELVDLAREVYWASNATDKRLVLHVHLGNERDPANQLLRVVDKSGIPPDRFVATHCNRGSKTLRAGQTLAESGVWVDISSTLDSSSGWSGAIGASEAVASLLDSGVPLEQISISSDGNGTVPRQAPSGRWDTYDLGLESLGGALFELVRVRGLGMAEALSLATANPARALGLQRKGHIDVGMDADILVLNTALELQHVYAKGQRLMADGIAVARGMLERDGGPGGSGSAGV